ncbi:hypothetical protein, partial [Janthinobacterium sp. HH100]|uniref:hypothetical protein n=1 Tax=Janthinobacterium sp. HH100 TaxID=1537272 RepID=UPI001C3063EA
HFPVLLFHHQIMRHHGLQIDADGVAWLGLGEPVHPALALRISLFYYFTTRSCAITAFNRH